MKKASEAYSHLAKAEDITYAESDVEILPPPDIFTFNELRSCADLLRMYENNELDIQPYYQREKIWHETQKARFIDSLIKRIPIPSICISYDAKVEQRQVVDGLQRISAIIDFLGNKDYKVSKLKDIDQLISGKKVSDIQSNKSTGNLLVKKVMNASIPVTVIQCDYSQETHNEYLFTIFHRLNTGGVRLNNQEIRNCIYAGRLNTLLKALAANKHWLKINKQSAAVGLRYKLEELVLRVIAFVDDSPSYKGKLSAFLNKYMHEHRNPTDDFLASKKKDFEEAVEILAEIADEKFVNRYSKSMVEAVMFGILTNLAFVKSLKVSERKARLAKILSSPALNPETLMRDVTGREKVFERLLVAKGIFKK